MDENYLNAELNIRPYIRKLIGAWGWILAATVGTAVLGFGAVSLLPAKYEATALVAINEARQVVEFDSGIVSEPSRQPLRAYPELALSDEVLRRVLQNSELLPPGIDSIDTLREQLSAVSGTDLALVRLTAEAATASDAADLVNSWVAAFVPWLNEVYASRTPSQIAFYAQQLAEAEEQLTTTEQELVNFESSNRLQLIQNQLDTLSSFQVSFLQRQQEISDLLQDIAGLHEQITLSSPIGNVSIETRLTALLLQLMVYGSESNSVLTVDLTGLDGLGQMSADDQLQSIDALESILRGRLVEVELALDELEPKILESQRELRSAQIERDRLERLYGLSVYTTNALQRELEESKLSSPDAEQLARLASHASIPEESIRLPVLLVTALAAVLGLLGSITFLISIQWWQSMGLNTTASSPGTHNRTLETKAPRESAFSGSTKPET